MRNSDTAAASEWTEIGPLIEAGQVLAVDSDGRAYVVWRTEGGRLAALDDECPHQGNPLSTGSVVGDELRCATHGWSVATDGWCDRAGIGTGHHRIRDVDGVMFLRPRELRGNAQGGR